MRYFYFNPPVSVKRSAWYRMNSTRKTTMLSIRISTKTAAGKIWKFFSPLWPNHSGDFLCPMIKNTCKILKIPYY